MNVHAAALDRARGAVKRNDARSPVDREALERAMYLLRRKKPEQIRMARIRDTAHLDRMLVSDALRRDVDGNERLEILGDVEEIRFDGVGNLTPDEVTYGCDTGGRDGGSAHARAAS